MAELCLNEFCVCERLAAYKFYSGGPVVCNHSAPGFETLCPIPIEVGNPNDYVIPDLLTGVQKRISSEQYEDGWNWGHLHFAVETLVKVGWQCFPLSSNFIVADDTQLVTM